MSQSTPLNMIRRNGGNNSDNSGFSSGGGGNQNQNIQMQMQVPQNGDNNSNGNGNGNMSSDSQLVEDILKEMGESPGLEQQSNINSQALHYAMDSAQIPAYKQASTNKNIVDIEQENAYNNYSNKIMMDHQNQNSFLGKLGFNLNGYTFKEKMMTNIKLPLLVFILCFLLSLPEFNRLLFGFFPRLLLESGQVSIGGVFLKAFVGMLLFICISLFI